MPLIQQPEIKAYLDGITDSHLSPVYLIFGEPYLIRRSLEMLLHKLLPEGKDFNYEPLDGAVADVRDAVRKAGTFSLFSTKKIVGLLETKAFFSKTDSENILSKAKDAFDAQDMTQASRYFLAWLAASDLDLDDLSEAVAEKKRQKGRDVLIENESWMELLSRYCRENGLSAPDAKEDAAVLEEAIRKGFPQGNALILSANRVDKRTSLYKAIVECGVAIDCSVPAGNTVSERKIREAVLKECTDEILRARGKAILPDAYAAVCEMTGFKLPIFIDNLEKLMVYSGDRSRIVIQDVEAILSRTREDPVFELTGAVMEKNADRALFFLDSLLRNDFHPMAVLAALVNQFRRLIMVKAFIEEEQGKVWKKGFDFNRFKEKVLPKLEAYESQVENALSDWEQQTFSGTPESSKSKAKKSDRMPADLMVLGRGTNAYPLFKLFNAADRFEKEELIQAFFTFSHTERKLKSTPLSPRILLEIALLDICGVGMSPDSPQLSAARTNNMP